MFDPVTASLDPTERNDMTNPDDAATTWRDLVDQLAPA